ncbi:LysR family transcriptional regulator [Aestuariispira insulae]|uniref:LysR family transcriptional regulator n=1 Tax=Aestuariispira insulae TaxID=1461337 RepID=UPI0015F29AED|nr:LysR family transcriptional regulator [Aestuariispira insulae]
MALETFKLVMDLGSVTAAAERLHTVQPNVTARLRKLEAELGVILFNRAHRRLTPTDKAQELLVHANEILLRVDVARQAVAGQGLGDVRMGFVSTQASKWLPAFIRDYRAAHPEAEIIVDTAATETLVREVQESRMDAAMVVEGHAGQGSGPALTATRLFSEKLVILAPPGTHSPEQAFSYPLMVLRQEQKGYRNFAHDLFQAMGREPPKLMKISTLEGVIACIRAGLGYSVLPRSVIAARHLEGALSILEPEVADIGIHLALVHRPELDRDPRMALLKRIFTGS